MNVVRGGAKRIPPLIKINHFTKHHMQDGDWTEYSGTLSIAFQVNNPGLGPAVYITFSAVLIAYHPRDQFLVGFYSTTIPSIGKQQSADVICDDAGGLSYAMINYGHKFVPPLSYKLIIFALFQDVSSQHHVQYQIFSQVPSILHDKFLSRYENAKSIFFNTLKELGESHKNEIRFQEKDTTISAIPVDHVENIILSKMGTASPILLTDDSVFVKDVASESVLISRGLPDPLKTDKIFETLTLQRYMTINFQRIKFSFPMREICPVVLHLYP